jgi:alpha-glucoside transport system permease protein
MATNEITADEAPEARPTQLEQPVRRQSPLRRAVDFVTRGPVQVVLIVIGLMWLLPTIGLFVSSLRSREAHAEAGWWTALLNPSQLTLDNYARLLDNPVMVNAFWNTVFITVPSTILVVLIASFAGYAFAWVEFKGRQLLFLMVVGLLAVPLQIGLIPIAQLFGRLGIFGSIPAVVLFHIGFGLPFAIFLMRNFFIGIPRDLM